MNKTGIAVFGGSFNPPTVAHLDLAKQILSKMNGIEKVIFVPVSTRYNKSGLAPDEVRLGFLKRICQNYSNIDVSNIEIKSLKQLYTIETLRCIKEKYQGKNIYFVIGTDNLKELETWHEPEKILTEFKIIVLERGQDNVEQIIQNSSFLNRFKTSFVKMDNIQKIDLSSSFVRSQIKTEKPIKGLVPEEIEEDVRRLYR